jgi:hypothetical protein
MIQLITLNCTIRIGVYTGYADCTLAYSVGRRLF